MSPMDYPNLEVLGLDPPWVEGTGGGGGSETPPPNGGEGGTPTTAELDAMTKEQLLAYAQSQGISPANNAMTKEDLRAGIDSHLGR